MNSIKNILNPPSVFNLPQADRSRLTTFHPDDYPVHQDSDSVTVGGASFLPEEKERFSSLKDTTPSPENRVESSPEKKSERLSAQRSSVPLVIPMGLDETPEAITQQSGRTDHKDDISGGPQTQGSSTPLLSRSTTADSRSRNFPGASWNWETIILSQDEVRENFRTAQEFFSQMNRFKDEFASNIGSAATELSSEEKAAVKDYTGGVFEHVNRYLRGNQTSFQKIIRFGTFGKYTKSLKATAKLVSSALNKMPPYEGKDVYRAVHLPGEVMAAYSPGAVVTEHGFTSCSKTMNGMRIKRDSVVFVIRSKTARDVQNLSLSGYEEEVLFRPESRFKVLSVEDGTTKAGKARFIYMEELQ